MDERLAMTQQSALASQKTKRVLGCIQGSMAGGGRKGFCSSALVRPPHCGAPSALGPPAQAGHGPAGADPKEAIKMIRGMEHLSYKERLRELVLFSLEQRSLWGDQIMAFQYLKRTGKKDRNGLLQEHEVTG